MSEIAVDEYIKRYGIKNINSFLKIDNKLDEPKNYQETERLYGILVNILNN